MIIELAKLGAMTGVTEATRAIWADDFDPETAAANDPLLRPLLGWYETIGTLVKNGLLDRELVYDWLWVAGTWERVGPAALRAREQSVPQMFENFEALAAGQREFQRA